MCDHQIPESVSWPPPDPEPKKSILNRLPVPLPVLIIVLAIAAILWLIFGVLRNGNGTEVVKPTIDPTVLAEYVIPATDSLVTDSGTPRPDISVPISITLKGLDYSVLPYQIQDDGEWHYPAGQSGTAVWVYGTIINFVIGLEQDKASLALLESMNPGDQITMTMSNGSINRFGFAGRGELASAGLDLYTQNRPGVTLVSLGGEGERRLVVYGEYLGIITDDSGSAGARGYAVGEPAQLGDIRTTILGTSYLFDDPQIPDGWAFYLVDYQIENLSQLVLDPNRFRMQLQDGVGNTYSLNLPASEAGTFGYLSLTIPPNTVAQGTAGYLVPAPLAGPQLGWSFSRLDVPESVAKFIIDFSSPQEIVDPRQLAAVSLTGAELSGDGTLLSLWGTILNNSEEELVVAGNEVMLTADADSMPLRSADPALPWSVAPGTVQSFELSFQRPTTQVAPFTVLNQPSEISGIE